MLYFLSLTIYCEELFEFHHKIIVLNWEDDNDCMLSLSANESTSTSSDHINDIHLQSHGFI